MISLTAQPQSVLHPGDDADSRQQPKRSSRSTRARTTATVCRWHHADTPPDQRPRSARRASDRRAIRPGFRRAAPVEAIGGRRSRKGSVRIRANECSTDKSGAPIGPCRSARLRAHRRRPQGTTYAYNANNGRVTDSSLMGPWLSRARDPSPPIARALALPQASGEDQKSPPIEP
jgi:hypothetical protein